MKIHDFRLKKTFFIGKNVCRNRSHSIERDEKNQNVRQLVRVHCLTFLSFFYTFSKNNCRKGVCRRSSARIRDEAGRRNIHGGKILKGSAQQANNVYLLRSKQPEAESTSVRRKRGRRPRNSCWRRFWRWTFDIVEKRKSNILKSSRLTSMVVVKNIFYI